MAETSTRPATAADMPGRRRRLLAAKSCRESRLACRAWCAALFFAYTYVHTYIENIFKYSNT